jgi:hypothetical protein
MTRQGDLLGAGRDRRMGRASSRSARRWMSIAATAGAVALAGATPVAAAAVVQDHYTVSGSETIEICGGTFEHAFAYEGTFSFVLRGTSPAPYGADRTHAVDRYTDPATGKALTNEFRGQFRDVAITIDDTTDILTLTGLKSGTLTAWVDTGTVVFRDAGTVRETVLIDDGGTPAVPDDDAFIADLGTTFGPHGRADTNDRDFCADLVALTN